MESIADDSVFICTVAGLSTLFGAAAPLMVRNIIKSYSNRRILHLSNSLHSLLYLYLSFFTIFFQIFPPQDCVTWKRFQSVLFNFYVLSYEFVLAYKAKTILGRRRLLPEHISPRWNITVADFLFLISVAIRVAVSITSTFTTNPVILLTSSQFHQCVNHYHPVWVHVNSISRNILELVWSLLFIIPIYYVLVSASHGKFYVKINNMAYKKIFIANCTYPLISILISTTITVITIIQSLSNPWIILLFGIQNFVSSYTINLILHVQVQRRGSISTVASKRSAMSGSLSEDSEFQSDVGYDGSYMTNMHSSYQNHPTLPNSYYNMNINQNNLMNNPSASITYPMDLGKRRGSNHSSLHSHLHGHSIYSPALSTGIRRQSTTGANHLLLMSSVNPMIPARHAQARHSRSVIGKERYPPNNSGPTSLQRNRSYASNLYTLDSNMSQISENGLNITNGGRGSVGGGYSQRLSHHLVQHFGGQQTPNSYQHSAVILPPPPLSSILSHPDDLFTHQARRPSVLQGTTTTKHAVFAELTCDDSTKSSEYYPSYYNDVNQDFMTTTDQVQEQPSSTHTQQMQDMPIQKT